MAFEEDGALGAADGFKECVVLHVARADLEGVNVWFHVGDHFGGQNFGDKGDFELVCGASQDADAFEAEALEGIGRCAGFEGAAAEHAGTELLDGLGGVVEYVLGFNGAGTGDDDKFLSAEDDVADGDGGCFVTCVSADAWEFGVGGGVRGGRCSRC